MEIKYLRNRLSKEELKKRNLLIVKDFNDGLHRGEMAKKYKVTVPQIYNIINSFKV